MTTKLFVQAITKYLAGVVLVGLLWFLPAGTFYYWESWLFIGILFLPMFVAGIILMVRNPELLRKRLNAKEEQNEQKAVVLISGLLFLTMFIVAGFNRRFMWYMMPDWAVYVAAAVFLIGYALYAEVLRENVWLSRTIEVQEEQQVVDTGLYGIVRHPMYSATLLLFLAMPLVLNSVWSFAIMLLYVPVIVKRIRNEEVVLEQGLAGYSDYMKRVRYRLIPFVW